MSLPRYPHYKDSGVEWLGDVPGHWKIVRYKAVFKEREERSSDGSETLLSVSAYTGVSPRSEIIDEGEHLSRAESLEGYKVCYPNDLVMNIMLAWNRGLGVTQYHGIVSPAYCVFKIIGDDDSRFLDYMVRSDQATLYYKAFSSGVIDSRLRLYPDTFSSLSCALPPKEEQAAIATFLDRETEKIDALIAEQEKLLVLLAEKRQATISCAITRGLNPNAPMKDSGIVWLGEVPEHWKTRRLKHVTDAIIDCPHETPIYDSDGDYMVIRTADVDCGKLSYEAMYRLDHDQYEARTRRATLAEGDIVYGREGERWGHAALVPESNRFCLGQRMMQFRPSSAMCPAFLMWQLNSGEVYRQGELDTVGATSPHVNVGTIRNFRLTVPHLNEQHAIAAHLNTQSRQFDDLTAEAQRAIQLLRERRGALIAVAVTGKIDVRRAI